MKKIKKQTIPKTILILILILIVVTISFALKNSKFFSEKVIFDDKTFFSSLDEIQNPKKITISDLNGQFLASYDINAINVVIKNDRALIANKIGDQKTIVDYKSLQPYALPSSLFASFEIINLRTGSRQNIEIKDYQGIIGSEEKMDISSDGKTIIWYSSTKAEIYIYEIETKQIKTIKPIEGQEDKFQVKNYHPLSKDYGGNTYGSKLSYYSHPFGFIDDENISYKTNQNETVFHNLINNEKKYINGDIITVLNDKYIIYIKTPKDLNWINTEYYLYNLEDASEVIFFPGLTENYKRFGSATMDCENKNLYFSRYNFGSDPGGEWGYAKIYKYNLTENKLSLINDSNEFKSIAMVLGFHNKNIYVTNLSEVYSIDENGQFTSGKILEDYNVRINNNCS